MKLTLLFSFYILFSFLVLTHGNQREYLDKLIKSRISDNPPNGDAWADLQIVNKYKPVYISPQDGLMEADQITEMPGQPAGVNFNQYSGYVTVNPEKGRALFYYFAESPENSATNPLVLWLNGGPGCSSLIGAMMEQGPFRVNADRKTLSSNPSAWNKVANVIFLESPVGVGYSYSNTTTDYDKTGDKNTAQDAYIFLVNWLERFPQYKNRDFYLTGESYAGHYIPQLAYTVLLNNKNSNQTIINLKGIAIGNALIDDYTATLGVSDYLWTHALISDETYKEMHKYCDSDINSFECSSVQNKGREESGNIDIYSIYSPVCYDSNNTKRYTASEIDPCIGYYTIEYMNLPEVQQAFHARPTQWTECSEIIQIWGDSPTSILPIINQLMKSKIRIWIYSGDVDGVVPVTATKYSLSALELPIVTSWRPWYIHEEVGGYTVEYKELVFVTVRGAGHEVPSYQPERALAMITSFLQGKLYPT